MIAEIRSRDLFHQNLQFTLNYTYSHSVDNMSSTFSEFGNNFNLGLLDPNNPSLDKGSSDFDQRQRLAFSGIWGIPYAKHTQGFVNQVLDGWSLTPIFTATTGTPYSVYDCTNGYYMCNRMILSDPTKISYTPASIFQSIPGVPNSFNLVDLSGQQGGTGDNAYYNPITGTADFGPYPKNMLGRNTFRAPGLWNLTMGIYKNFKLKKEGYSLQFRSEFYNMLNHANLYASVGSADISSQLYVPGYRDGRRNVQFALKFIF